jgi:hypothetical protein
LNPNYTTYTTFESIADTVLGGHSARIINEIKRTGPQSSTFFQYYMYSDSVSVYNWRDSSWCTLYRFGAVGDSFEVNCTGLMVRIHSIDTISINGHQRKVYQYDASSMAIEFAGAVIEGVGHTFSMFPTYDNDNFPGPLRCYEDTIIGLYKSTYYGQSGNQDCEEIIDRTAIDLVNSDGAISVNPLLVTQAWTEITVSAPTDVRIFSITGQLLMEQTIISHEQINLASYPDGQYIIGLTQNNNVTYSKRLVKINR